MPAAQETLLNELTTVNKNIIVVLSAGSAIEMPWYPYVKGIVHGYLGGQAGASAMMNVLTGKVNPSGKLNETYPLHYEDTPAYAYYPSKESLFMSDTVITQLLENQRVSHSVMD